MLHETGGRLAYTAAALLQGLIAFSPEDAAREERQAQLDRWYEIAADCDDAQVREQVAAVLAARYSARGDWDAAQRAIDAMPERPALDQRVAQANLCLQRGEHAEAAKLLEGAVLADASQACSALAMLAQAELAAGEREAAMEGAKVVEAAVRDLDLWSYIGFAAPLQCAMDARDAPEALRCLRRLLDALGEPWRPADSPLYRRIAGTKQGTLNARFYALILADLEANPDYDFLRGEAEFQEILAAFRKRAEAA